MIQMYQVNKSYAPDVKALENINLHIQKGEFVFLVGPSGAGKTTLMRLIFRDEKPTSGNILIDGRNIERLSLGAIPYLRRSIGVVFQDFKLMANKTAFENVAFALRVVEASTDEIEHKTMQVLEMMGLSHRKSALPHEMSGGEQQRICIARALVNDPAILLTDEPTGNLDPELSYEIMKILLDIHERGTTVMVATHDASLVNRLQRRVLHLKDGKVINDSMRGTYHDET
ncbi:MAG: cell division ATP-binding protein FtsE [Candidatus Cloacimonadota bacterium]|nr:MAG: cell division ATP-binding protein FtsE [Candidatus Cloacimonadota bacterium]